MAKPKAKNIAARFIHTADWQLGMTRRFLSPEAQARFSAARVDAVRRIGEVAAEKDCGFVLACGDLFESNQIDRKVLVRALEAMATIPVPVYLLPGNHDPADAGSLYRSPTFLQHRPANLVVLDGAEVQEVTRGVELVPAPWASKRPLEDLIAKACRDLKPDETVIRIVVGHGVVNTLAPDPSNPACIDLSLAERAVASGCVDYIALGDRHSVTEVGTTGRIWYAGAPEATDFDEVDSGKVLVVELGERETVQPFTVGRWRFLRGSFDVSGAEEVDAVAAWLDAQSDKERAIVKLSFVGTLTLRENARLEETLSHYGDLFAALDTWDRRTELAVLPDDVDFGDLGLTGFAADSLADLAEQASASGEGAAAARDALSLLYRLSRGAA